MATQQPSGAINFSYGGGNTHSYQGTINQPNRQTAQPIGYSNQYGYKQEQSNTFHRPQTYTIPQSSNQYPGSYDYNRQSNPGPLYRQSNQNTGTFMQQQNSHYSFGSNSQNNNFGHNSYSNTKPTQNQYHQAPIQTVSHDKKVYNAMSQNEPSRYKLQNIPEAKQDDFKPGCFGKGQKGIVYESHQKTTSFC